MRRLEPWSIALVAALLLLGAVLAPPLWTGAQPAPGDPADGPLRETLLQAILDDLPEPPAFVRLVRITLQPGASVPMHTHPGPEFGRVESGTLTVRVDGEVVIAQASVGGTPQPPRVPPVGQEFELRPGDQIVYPAEVPLAFSNRGREPTTVLTAVILPAGSGRPPGSEWVGGTPGPEAMLGVSSQIMGDAVAPGWPATPFLIVLDRLVLAPGQGIPARGGPVLMSVELGRFGFALVEGQFQVSRGDSGPQANATPGVAYVLSPGDAVFFPGGMNEVPRTESDGVLVLLRLSVLNADDAGALGATAPPDPDPEPGAGAGAGAQPTPAPAADGFAVGATAVVTEAGVRLRDSPSASGGVVAELAQGQPVVVTGAPVEGDGIVWYPVQAADDAAIVGFIAEEFLAPQ